ncbi:MAG TPA: bifunctional glutamate N-acetyltransferase/amino-acid acetyltransferase ArgJ [Polyangiaceae bacterium]
MPSPVQGFRFSAVSAGIRKDGRVDLALAVADKPVVAAGRVTRNLVKAAPVLIASERLQQGLLRGVLVNSGCANACTGEPGLEAARRSTSAVARVLGATDAEIIPASTGVIGALLPAEKIEARVSELVLKLSPTAIDDFALAICTTDRWPKVAYATIETPKGKASLLGIAKGAGMIHPNLGPPQATMLCFLFTDAIVERPELEGTLMDGVDQTFNACSVDGDTSTNDLVLALASGASGVVAHAEELLPAIHTVCDKLARSMVRDGEGSEHAVDIVVKGLTSDEEAQRVARTVATSMLVKTAIFGKDANWGRLLAAAGRAGVAFDPNAGGVSIAGIEIARRGLAVGGQAEVEAQRRMAQETYVIELVLGDGLGQGRCVTSDLGHGYVDVNAGYRS